MNPHPCEPTWRSQLHSTGGCPQLRMDAAFVGDPSVMEEGYKPFDTSSNKPQRESGGYIYQIGYKGCLPAVTLLLFWWDLAQRLTRASHGYSRAPLSLCPRGSAVSSLAGNLMVAQSSCPGSGIVSVPLPALSDRTSRCHAPVRTEEFPQLPRSPPTGWHPEKEFGEGLFNLIQDQEGLHVELLGELP